MSQMVWFNHFIPNEIGHPYRSDESNLEVYVHDFENFTIIKKSCHYVLIKFSQIIHSSAKLITAVFMGLMITSGNRHFTAIGIKIIHINLYFDQLNDSSNPPFNDISYIS